MTAVRNPDLLYPELSYKIVGCAYDVYNELGPGHLEKHYQRAMVILFKERNIPFEEELYAPIIFHNEVVSKLYLDFLVDKSVVVELKKGNNFSKRNIEQVSEYLNTSKLKLAINFGSDKVYFKRVINFNQ